MTTLIDAVRFARRQGAAQFVGELRERIYSAYHERRLNVRTSSMLTSAELSYLNPECLDYVPLGYGAIFSLLKRMPEPTQESVFLDYGAGKGRVISVAATFPYKRVIGVELSASLVQLARENVASMRYRKAREVAVVECDAMHYEIPPDVDAIYMFNPFRGEILKAVLENVRRSLAMAPRRLTLVAVNNSATIDGMIGEQRWLRKTAGDTVYPGYPCGIYSSQ